MTHNDEKNNSIKYMYDERYKMQMKENQLT